MQLFQQQADRGKVAEIATDHVRAREGGDRIGGVAVVSISSDDSMRSNEILQDGAADSPAAARNKSYWFRHE